MATEKTPAHKRISRAENSAAEWKMKAIERREAAEALKEQLATASENVRLKKVELDKANQHCRDLDKRLEELTEKLRLANQSNTTLQVEMDEFKKKSIVNRRQAS